jgi:hypothetical protein
MNALVSTVNAVTMTSREIAEPAAYAVSINTQEAA